MRDSSMIRKAYDAVSLFALLNLITMMGGAAYLFGTGIVTPERLRSVVEYVREQESTTEEADTAEVSQPAPDESADEMPGTRKQPFMAHVGTLSTEILRREAERVKGELDQQLALNHSIMLRITEEREAFRREREREAARRAEEKEELESSGFEKQRTLFNELSPKVAVQHLLAISDPLEAARLLASLDTRKAKRIIESAKSQEEQQKMQRVLQKLSEVSPAQSSELENPED